MRWPKTPLPAKPPWYILPLFQCGLAVNLNVSYYLNDDVSSSSTDWLRYVTVAALGISTIMLLAFVQVTKTLIGNPTRYLVPAFGFWLAAPGLVAGTFADSQASPHDWLSLAWYWTLEPLPFKVTGPLAWEAPTIDYATYQGVVLILLQVSTIGVVLAGLAAIVEHYRRTRRS